MPLPRRLRSKRRVERALVVLGPFPAVMVKGTFGVVPIKSARIIELIELTPAQF